MIVLNTDKNDDCQIIFITIFLEKMVESFSLISIDK